MPAKKQITREAILNSALEVVRAGGMEALNMRSLAQACNCSTQPIYLSFSGIDELKREVEKKIIERFKEYIAKAVASGEYGEYKAMGMGYIRFAQEEPHFFNYLFMRKRGSEVGELVDTFNESVLIVMRNYGLYKDDASRLHAEMWIFVHGIATMFATGYLDWDWETVSSMVSEAFFGISSQIEASKRGENK